MSPPKPVYSTPWMMVNRRGRPTPGVNCSSKAIAVYHDNEGLMTDVGRLVDREVTVRTTSGESVTGILHTVTEKFQLVIMGFRVEKGKRLTESEKHERLIVDHAMFVSLSHIDEFGNERVLSIKTAAGGEAVEVCRRPAAVNTRWEMLADDTYKFKTDTDISKGGKKGNKNESSSCKLVPFFADGEEGAGECLEETEQKGWDSAEMIKAFDAKNPGKSSYKGIDSAYTNVEIPQLDEDTKKKLDEYAKNAKITNDDYVVRPTRRTGMNCKHFRSCWPVENDGKNEEERFSSVVRRSNGREANSQASSSSSSNNNGRSGARGRNEQRDNRRGIGRQTPSRYGGSSSQQTSWVNREYRCPNQQDRRSSQRFQNNQQRQQQNQPRPPPLEFVNRNMSNRRNRAWAQPPQAQQTPPSRRDYQREFPDLKTAASGLLDKPKKNTTTSPPPPASPQRTKSPLHMLDPEAQEYTPSAELDQNVAVVSVHSTSVDSAPNEPAAGESSTTTPESDEIKPVSPNDIAPFPEACNLPDPTLNLQIPERGVPLQQVISQFYPVPPPQFVGGVQPPPIYAPYNEFINQAYLIAQQSPNMNYLHSMPPNIFPYSPVLNAAALNPQFFAIALQNMAVAAAMANSSQQTVPTLPQQSSFASAAAAPSTSQVVMNKSDCKFSSITAHETIFTQASLLQSQVPPCQPNSVPISFPPVQHTFLPQLYGGPIFNPYLTPQQFYMTQSQQQQQPVFASCINHPPTQHYTNQQQLVQAPQPFQVPPPPPPPQQQQQTAYPNNGDNQSSAAPHSSSQQPYPNEYRNNRNYNSVGGGFRGRGGNRGGQNHQYFNRRVNHRTTSNQESRNRHQHH